MDGRIFHIREKLSENPGFPWTIRELADLVGLSIPHFQRLFRDETGAPPMAYIRDARLINARELLETTLLSIKEIRFKVGLIDASHFTRDFRKKFGAAPREYRKLHWEKIQAEQPTVKK